MTDDLQHYGTPRHSGRYPWGSGGHSQQSSRDFLGMVDKMKKDGLSQLEIARGLGMTTSELRNRRAIARNETRKADQAMAFRLKEKGYSNVAIGERMGINESSVRSLLNPSVIDRTNVLNTASSFLKDQVAEKRFIDIGSGAEYDMDMSASKLRTVVAKLKDEEGYKVYYVKVKQLGTGHETTVKVLAPPDATYSELYKNQDKIRTIEGYSEDGGRTLYGIETPRSVSSDRIQVRYAEEGGTDADGVLYLRPGVDDLSMGNKRYAQVRVAVDDTHFLKGMAMYRDDLPDGVDIVFNTNKSNTGNKLDAMKTMKTDEDNPFGAVIKKQRHYLDANGKEQLSALNIVNEEGDWGEWSKTLSSQMLSKQRPSLAKQQLELAYLQRQNEFEEIMSLTNPAVKKKLLESFADEADSAAVHLKAAHLPRQASHVILPINSLGEKEIYAPNYKPGESVVLIRYPHGGTFEIPELTVNNRNQEARRLLGNVPDAVGINAKVAQRLSGADFDGDTVLVIPNNTGAIKTSSPLAQLRNFDPQAAYPGYEGMKPITPKNKQTEMGKVSNLITDMTIRGASHSEIARAVRHSMVVIDAEKHKLNYKQSEIDNGIAALKEKYQGGKRSGASTLISRASSEARPLARKPRSSKEGGPIDKETGEKRFTLTDESYTDSKGRVIKRTTKSTQMAEVRDAYELSSGTPMEALYADHANRLKALANRARKTTLTTPNLSYSESAARTYKPEVDSLTAALNVARKNRPRERQAQILANAVVSQKRQDNPGLEASDIKKISGQALQEARNRVGAKKTPINITPREWEAIQAGALRPTRLSNILAEASLDQVRQLATPRQPRVLTSAVMARARSMLASGATQAEVAEALGIPTSTLNSGLREEG